MERCHYCGSTKLFRAQYRDQAGDLWEVTECSNCTNLQDNTEENISEWYRLNKGIEVQAYDEMQKGLQ